MRIRTVKPEFYASESIGRLSRDARGLFIGLFSLSDDHGRFRAHPRYIASNLYAYDDDALALMPGWLAELEAEGCVVLYSAGGNSYGAIPKWPDHQKIDKPSASKLPAPPDSPTPREDSPKPRERSSEDQGSGKGEDQGGEAVAKNREPQQPPSLQKVELKKSLVATYRENKLGTAYGWSKADDTALEELLELAEEPEEVIARWGVALRSRKKFPTIATLKELAQHWNQFPVHRDVGAGPSPPS